MGYTYQRHIYEGPAAPPKCPKNIRARWGSILPLFVFITVYLYTNRTFTIGTCIVAGGLFLNVCDNSSNRYDNYQFEFHVR